MNDERTRDLVSAAADGELDAHERQRVEQLLGESSAARELRADLQRLEAVLTRQPEPAFPPGLHERIMAGVRRQERTRVGNRFAQPGTLWRYGLAAAAGVVLTIAVVSWQPVDTAQYGELTGSVVAGADRTATRVLSRAETQVDGVAGIVELREGGGQLLLDIRMDTGSTSELTVDFSASGLRPAGVLQSSAPFESIEITGAVLRARASGRQQASVSLRREEDAAAAHGAAIRLEYSSNGRVLEQGTLDSAME